MELSESNVLVTGASRGLGAALARQLAKRGARVVLVARGEAQLRKVVDSIRRQGGEAHGLVFDLGDQRAIIPLAQAAQGAVGAIDILIHNASTLGPVPLRPLLETECEDLERVLAVNLLGPFRLSKALAGNMVLRKRGLILTVSSDAAVEAYPNWGAYSISKAALDHLSRVLASELQEHGVRVVAVDPGEMDTEMHAAALPDADRENLAKPETVAARILELLTSSAGLDKGVRRVVGVGEAA